LSVDLLFHYQQYPHYLASNQLNPVMSGQLYEGLVAIAGQFWGDVLYYSYFAITNGIRISMESEDTHNRIYMGEGSWSGIHIRSPNFRLARDGLWSKSSGLPNVYIFIYVLFTLSDSSVGMLRVNCIWIKFEAAGILYKSSDHWFT
jgi:hypothetical protein